ncbi:unnamed protein product [Cyprideis torosa]|uniref:Uncharacterized protein n=1 Tax=Cyprideis torosa TaxID=163714 RepID=A0A7R8WJ10_9CRUS|nr:unnamed protein product [Cyprideis torosa]CAG0901400.1 unnamed protein product [Cyprideis torosa]
MSSVNSVSGAVINIFKGSSRGDLRQSLWRKYENLFGSKASSTAVSWNEDVLERPRMYQHPLSETAPIPASERVEEVTEAPWWRKQELLPPVNKFVAGWYDLKDMDEKEEKWRQLLGEHYDHRGARKKKQMHEPIDWRHGQRSLVEKKFLTHRTYQVLDAVFQSKDSIERSARMQLLVQHLWDFPLSRPIAIRADAIKRLLQLRDSDEAKGIEGEIRQGLTLLGYVFSPIGNGIRLLSLDGGGTRGVVSLEVLRRLESLTGKRIHQLFDMIVGVSTGALIGFLLGPMKKSVTECEVMYRDMAQRIFAPSSFLKHQMNLITTHGYYSAQGLTDVMKEILGETQLVDTMRDPECPKIAIISALVNVGPLQPFVFRNYTIPPFTSASCPGTTDFLIERVEEVTEAPWWRKQELLPPVNKFVAGWYDLKDMDEKEEKWRQLLGEHYDHRGARKKKQMHEPIDWRHGQRSLVEKKFLTHRTYQVLDAVFQSKDSIERSARMQLLVQHLWDFPLSRPIAIRADAIKRLLQLRDSDEAKGIEGEIRQGLTLLGYVFSPIGNGIRLLSLDGGPMKKSVTECEVMYRDMAQRIFAPSSFLKHQMNLITTHGYYSAQGLTDVMKEILGETQLVDTMRDPECPKIAIISALVNVGPLQPFVFRNYTIPPFTSASCPGTTDFLMWEGGRATTSAPGYFQEFWFFVK